MASKLTSFKIEIDKELDQHEVGDLFEEGMHIALKSLKQ